MATAPTRPQLKERFERRRAEVLDRCAAVFAERGFDGATIDDLSAATGLAAGGLYHYIGSKDLALFEILNQLMAPLLERAQAIAESKAPARDRLRQLIELWVRHVADHRDHMLIFSQERHILERDPERWSEIRRSRRQFERLLASLLEETAAELDAAPPPDLKMIELALLGMVNYTPQWLKPNGRLRAEEIAAAYFELVLARLMGLTPLDSLGRGE
jgi:AcrR family transcriptional regulator